MKQRTKQKFPPGWDEKKVRAVIVHYDQQSDEEGAAEIDSAPEAEGETWMSVPNKLVGEVNRLIKSFGRKNGVARARNGRK